MNKILSLIALGLAVSGVASGQDARPNVIIFLADDAGYADFGFTKSKENMLTPNIDRMVENGVRMMDMHVSGSVSGPSRCGMMTGRYQHRFGCETNASAEVGLPTSEKFMSEYFKELGYATAAYGKWHLGSKEEYHPNSRGFDEFYGFLGGHRNYFYSPADLKSKSKSMQLNGTNVAFEGYLTDVLGNKAIDFIDENKENPFFIYLAYNAVHTPLQATKEDLARFEGHPRQMVAAMTWALDRSIGNVIKKVEDEGLIENTIFVFLSDNGGDAPKCNDPLKAHKGTEYEGGHRVPCAIQWKGTLKPGLEFDGLSTSLDLLPTFMDAAGVKKLQAQQPLDGVSLLPYLNNEKKGNPHEWLFWRVERWRAVRFNDYKYVYAEGVGEAMYSLEDDLSESENLIEKEPKVYKKMKRALSKWESETVPPLKGGEKSWEKVKAYMYDDLFHNRKIRYNYPGEVKHLPDFDKK